MPTPSFSARSRRLEALAARVLLAGLAACSGGGGDPAPPPPPAPGITLVGIVATGAAVAGTTVEAKCATGAGQATSTATGAYSLKLDTGVGPCVLRAAVTGGTVLHSTATGTGGTVTANLTPFTHLAIAHLAGAQPSAYYAAFTAATARSAAAVAQASSDILLKLKAGGIDVSSIANVFTGTLVAANSGTAGNAYDLALDALDESLDDQGLTLDAYTQAVADASPANPAPVATPTLPPEMRLQPAAANCQALRSGRYRHIAPERGGAPGAFSTSVFTLDAPAGVVTDEDGSTVQLTATANPCEFTLADGRPVVVSQAGVVIFRSLPNATQRLGIAFPEQAHAVAELQGTWQSVAFELNAAGTAYEAQSVQAGIDANGVTTSVLLCAGIKTCVTFTPTITRTVHPGGGFLNSYADGNDPDRTFAYRTGSGELMLVSLAGNGSFDFATRQRTGTLPAVGTVNDSWTLPVDSQLQAGALGSSHSTVLTTDAVNGTYTRQNGATAPGATRTESLAINNPRAGYTLRNLETVTNSLGGTETVSELIWLNLRGTGVTAIMATAGPTMFVAVNKP